MPEPTNEPNLQPQNSPRDWLFIAAISPLMILLGFHIAGLALLSRKYLRVPYIVGVSVLMAGLSLPLIATRGDHPVWIPLAAVFLVQILVFGAHAIGYTKQELFDGGNVEYIAPAHMMLCIMFLLLPAIYAARDAYNWRNTAVHAEPPTARFEMATFTPAAGRSPPFGNEPFNQITTFRLTQPECWGVANAETSEPLLLASQQVDSRVHYAVKDSDNIRCKPSIAHVTCCW